MKVPLNLGWLSENDLLQNSLVLRQFRLLSVAIDGLRIECVDGKGKTVYMLNWQDNLMFTLDELKQLGFE